ncbi:AAA family ATPase [Sphaerospermopsis aphanizomenoides BCCUSP55]|uniref:AAA family ATPase n=1 Tax=Sphaerospermopsis aphanizomenoides TaxID=459663 RepID=UPI0019075108|nr:AAA family ATPase [Sphaerospermopsis aphanizomenoides]MBK1989259.1 AAA family ATPase [Sphaerospermopsis aphanizomenoides BCCUSP55]
MTNSKNKFFTYIGECLRLLYWTYFKPYTFKYWLQDIHPELKLKDNPFKKRDEFSKNAKLNRYAGQISCLITVIPILAVLVVGLIDTLNNINIFDWLRSSLVLFCCLIGLTLGRYYNTNRIIHKITLIIVIIALSQISVIIFYPSKNLSLMMNMTSVLLMGIQSVNLYNFGFSIFLAIVVNLVSSISNIDILINPQFNLSCGVAIGMMFGLAYSVYYEIARGLILGVVGGFTLVVGVDLPFGMGIGLGFIVGVLRICFWLPEIWGMYIQFLTSVLDPQNIDVYLRNTPPFFDELIILPLPFMDEMILETYKTHPQIAKDTLDYLISYTNQQKLASRVIIDINVDTFIRCRKVSDIVAIANQPIWRISQIPEGSDNILRPFLEISQDVITANEATSRYRQYELLNIPIRNLQALKQNLAFNKNAILTTQFSKVAELWLIILETAQHTLKQEAERTQEIPQVYIAGNSLDPETAKNRFKGRIDIFREIENITLSTSPPVLLLFGGRRTGKTSALKYLPHKIGSTIIPLLVDLQGAASATTLRGLAENLAKSIIEAAQRLPTKINLSYPNEEQICQEPFLALQTWFSEIERTYPNKKFLLCLDEYERLSEVIKATNSRVPLNFIRNVIQHQRQWILLFSGSHQLSELPDYWSDYLINTRALRMTYLQESEARELILNPVEKFPEIYEDAAVDRIIQLTHCQPYLVQLVCYELVELINRDIRGNRRESTTAKVTSQDVEFIIDTVLETGDPYFRELWTSLANNDRDFLRRLIYGETPTQQDKGVMKKLTRKEILTPEGNAFQVLLVQRFVEQLIEEE